MFHSFFSFPYTRFLSQGRWAEEQKNVLDGNARRCVRHTVCERDPRSLLHLRYTTIRPKDKGYAVGRMYDHELLTRYTSPEFLGE